MRYCRFIFVEKTISNSPKVPRAKFLGSDGFFCFSSIASLVASRTLLQWLLACLNFTLDSEDLFCWYKWKEWFLWTMAPAQAVENHGDEWILTWYIWWGICTSISTWTHSQNSPAAAVAEVLSLKISSHETSLKSSQRPSQSAWK